MSSSGTDLPAEESETSLDRIPAFTSPRSLTHFIGRERERSEVIDLLNAPEVRLVTLTGPGGVGKTRLALSVAELSGETYRDGALFVPLATVTDPQLVIPAIATALELGDGGDRPLIERTIAALVDRHLLLVLDNLEQVLSAGPLIGQLLRSTGSIQFLVTSRAPLRIEGEQEYAVPPLHLPDLARVPTPAELAKTEAGALFVQTARGVSPGFALTASNTAAVAEICRLVEGLPLAVELAAARTKVLSPQELLTRLDRQLQVLTGGPRDRPLRQRTMRDAIAWSYDLLDQDLQAIFRRLSIFRGGFTLELAEEVLGSIAPGHNADLDVLDGITQLADQSLLVREEQSDGASRYRMLETIREFGRDQLVATGELDAIHTSFASHWLTLADATWAVASSLDTLNLALVGLEEEHDNIRAALDWLEHRDLSRAIELSGANFWFWYVRGHHAEALLRLGRMLNQPTGAIPTRALARATMAAGIFSHFQGRTEDATDYLERALTGWRKIEDSWGTGFSLFVLGVIAEDIGDYDRALPLLDEATALLRRAGDDGSTGSARYHRAVVAFGKGDLEGSFATLKAILEESAGKPIRVTAWAIHLRGLIAHARGESAAALADFQESLRRFREVRYTAGITEALAGVAVATGSGSQIEAVRIWAAAEALAANRGDAFQFPERAVYDATERDLRARLGEEAYATEQAVGRAWTLDEAMDAALAVTVTTAAGIVAPDNSAPVPLPGGLSTREAEVLRFVAIGWTNDQIAAHLFLSPRTVHAHLTTVYRKLGVANRAAAVRFAMDHNLAG